MNVTQNIKFVFYEVENIVGKEEIAGYQNWMANDLFLLSMNLWLI